MNFTIETNFLNQFDIPPAQLGSIQTTFFPGSGAPKIAGERMVFNRTVYYDRFILFLGHDSTGIPIQRMVFANPAGHNTIEDIHCHDGRVYRKRFDFTFGANSAPFKLEALPPLTVSGFCQGSSLFVELGGFKAPRKTGFDCSIRLGLTILDNSTDKKAKQVFLSVESTSNEEQQAIVYLVQRELEQLNFGTASPHLYTNSNAAMSFVDAWANHLGLPTATTHAGDR